MHAQMVPRVVVHSLVVHKEVAPREVHIGDAVGGAGASGVTAITGMYACTGMLAKYGGLTGGCPYASKRRPPN